MSDLCKYLKLYLNLCKTLINSNKINFNRDHEANHYISRYLIIIINMLITKLNVFDKLRLLCSEKSLEKLSELSMKFFHAEYSYVKDDDVVKLLKIVCPCIARHIDILC